MARKYTVEIEAQVEGQEEVNQLTEEFNQLASSAEDAQIQIKEVNKETGMLSEDIDATTKSTNELTSAQKQALNVTGRVAGAAAMNAAAIYAGRQAMAGASAGAIRFIPLIGQAVAVVMALVTAMGFVNDAVDRFVDGNVEAQKELERNLAPVGAWTRAIDDVKNAIGEAFYMFRDFWTFFKGITTQWLFGLVGLREYTDETLRLVDAQQYLNTEMEKQVTLVANLEYAIKGLQKVYQDEDKDINDRVVALGNWLGLQQQIILSKKRELDARKLIAESKLKERPNDQAEIDNLEKINRGITANDRALKDLNISYQEMLTTMIELYKERINQQAWEEYQKRSADYREGQQLKEIDRLNQLDFYTRMLTASTKELNDEQEQAFDFEEEDEYEDPIIKLYNERRLAKEEYDNFLQSSLLNMGTIWTDAFRQLNDIYKWDEENFVMSSEQKQKAAVLTAAISMQAAGQLIAVLAEGAEQSFETQKKYQLAEIVISTLTGVAMGIANAMSMQPPPLAWAMGAISTALVLASGIAAYTKVSQSTPENASLGGGGGAGAGGGTQTTAPSLSLVSPMTQGETQLGQMLGGELEPAKSYVVSTDMTDQQELDRRIESNASL